MIRLLYGAVFVVCLAKAVKKAKGLSHLSLPSVEPVIFQTWITWAGIAALFLNWYLGFMMICIGFVVAWSGLLASGIAVTIEMSDFKRKFRSVPSDFMRTYQIVLAATVLGIILETAFGMYIIGEMLAMSGGCAL